MKLIMHFKLSLPFHLSSFAFLLQMPPISYCAALHRKGCSQLVTSLEDTHEQISDHLDCILSLHRSSLKSGFLSAVSGPDLPGHIIGERNMATNGGKAFLIYMLVTAIWTFHRTAFHPPKYADMSAIGISKKCRIFSEALALGHQESVLCHYCCA